MNCLPLEKIYLHLEGELPASEARSLEEHIQRCPSCQAAAAGRRELLQAVASLPSLPVPRDFSARIMERIFTPRVSLGRAFITAAAGSAAIVFGLFAIFLFSGQNLWNFLVSANHSVLSGLSDLTVAAAKLVKLLSLLARVITRFAGVIAEGFTRLTTILSPEFQAGLILITLIISAVVFYGIRRKLLLGVKR